MARETVFDTYIIFGNIKRSSFEVRECEFLGCSGLDIPLRHNFYIAVRKLAAAFFRGYLHFYNEF